MVEKIKTFIEDLLIIDVSFRLISMKRGHGESYNHLVLFYLIVFSVRLFLVVLLCFCLEDRIEKQK